MILETSFGHWLMLRRRALRLSCVELARRVGCATVTLHKIEADERRPSRQIAALLAEHLAVAAQEQETFIRAARGELCADQLPAPDQPANDAARTGRAVRSTDLPIPSTPLIGRAADVAAVRELLLSSDVRLLTLTGAPGIGKTRLAREVAADVANDQDGRQFADGVYFISLAPIRDPGLVIAAIAQALEVGASSSQPELEGLQAYLRGRHILLVLDNFEQVLKAAPQLAALLAVAARLTLLVTSRVALHLSGEHRFAVPPLALPGVQHLTAEAALASALVQYAAVELFVERAWSVAPSFALTDANALAVATICAHLDGLPLAIELAAARMALFAPQELLARPDHRLALLTEGAVDMPTRQQTLRRAIMWSYDLLDAPEQALFRRLSVFIGGCTLEAAERVCNAADDLGMQVLDGVTVLVDNSLLQRVQGADRRSRFTMLETIREYALEQLEESSEAQTIRQRHTAYFLALAEAAEPQLRRAAQVIWWERLESEHTNLRAALTWVQERGEAAMALRLGAALWWFWFVRGYWSEGRTWLETMLTRTEIAGRLHIRANVDLGAGVLALFQGNDPAARTHLEASRATFREEGEKLGVAYTLIFLGLMAMWQGDRPQAITLVEESLALFQQQEDQWGLALALASMGRYGRVEALLEESLVLWQRLGDTWGMAHALASLGDMALEQGDYTQAATLYEKSLPAYQEMDDKRGIAFVLRKLAEAAWRQGDLARAEVSYLESLALCRDLGHKRDITWGLEGLAAVVGALGRSARAARLFGAAKTLRDVSSATQPRLDHADYERIVAVVRAQLGQDAFAAAWEAGQALSLEQAITYALEA